MGNIYKRDGENTVYVTKVPEAYIKGRGIRYNSRYSGIKLRSEFLEFFCSLGAATDLYKALDFFKVLTHNAYHSQTLIVMTSQGGRKYARPMKTKDMAKYIGKTERSVFRLLHWLMDKDLVRRGKDGSLVVNPDRIILGSRLHASEYYLFRDILQDRVSKKYDRLLMLEYLDCLEDYTEEEIKEMQRLKQEELKENSLIIKE